MESDNRATLTPVFVHQLMEAQITLFSYVLLLVGNPTDARDVLQDTNVVLMRDASHFDPSTSFLAWSKTVAYYQVLAYRKKKSRDRLVFDDALFQQVAETLEERPERTDARVDAVSRCLKKLSDTQRAFIQGKYFERLSIPALAARFSCSTAAAVSLLYRIRKQLALCVETELKEDV